MEKIHQLTKKTMELVGQTVRNTPCIPTTEEMKLRLALEFEELFEKAQAMGLEASFAIMTAHSYYKRAVVLGDVSPEEYDSVKVFIEDRDSCVLKDTNEVNLVEVFDAALDQRVVASGTDLCFGFQNIIVPGDVAVWTSNMSKFDTEYTTALEGVAAYKDGTHPHCKEAVEAYIHSKDGYHIIKRQDNHKYLKSLNYSAVDLHSLVGIEVECKTIEDGDES